MKRRNLIIALLLLVTGFGVWRYIHRPVELEKQPVILGHGGMGVRSLITLDSKRSIQEALAYPIDGSEVDVSMTADGVLIAYHDDKFPTRTNCPGPMWAKNYAEIYACSHGVLHNAEPVEAMDTLLDFFSKDGRVFSLDLKPEADMDSARAARFRSQIIQLTDQFPQVRFLIESQQLELLIGLHKEGAAAELFYYTQDAEQAIAGVLENQLNGISINAGFISKEQIREAQERNITVMIWGTGSVFSNRKFLHLNADIIQTDAIPSMVTLLDR